MIRTLLLALALSLSVLTSGSALASNLPTAERTAIIQDALDCLEQSNRAHSDLGWGDTCVSQAKENHRAKYFQENVHPSSSNVYIPTAPRHERDRNNNYEFALEFFQHNYEQEGYLNNQLNPVQKTNDGNLVGLYFAYEHVFEDVSPLTSPKEMLQRGMIINRIKFEAEAAKGSTNYTDERIGDLGDFGQYMLELRTTGGYDFYTRNQTRISPYTGLGYRYLKDTSGDITDFPANTFFIEDPSITWTRETGIRQEFDKDHHYFYIPLGVTSKAYLAPTLSLSLNLEYDFVFYGDIRSKYSDIGPIYSEDNGDRTMSANSMKTELNSTHGLRGSMRLTKEYPQTDFFVEPFFRLWKTSESDDQDYPLQVSDGGKRVFLQPDGVTPYRRHEPGDVTTEVGIRIGAIF